MTPKKDDKAPPERLLERIEGPADLHDLDEDQLEQVAQEMRTYIIDTIGEIGGHFGANLGACEIAVALHSLLDSPRDKVLWDVGHQSYPHKVLTGRREQLPTIRQYEGLAPFCSIFESEHDIMGAGHASTSVGYAVGLKAAIKAYWAPGLLFEELDLAYVGVTDGHDVKALRRALSEAFEAERPVVVHVHTVKGKGFAPSEEGGLEGMEKWHAAKPGSIVDRKPAPKKETDSPEPIEKLEAPPPADPPQYTQVFANALVDEAKRDRRVIGITAAMAGGTGLDKLCREVSEQYYDVGIAEQDAVLFASGLALQGAKPVCAIYSTFLQRAFDQIVHDVCLQSLNVVFAMDRAGLVGDDGPTHHGAFDVSYFRPLPNVVLMAPRDEAMLVHMLRTALAHDGGPIAFRYPRGAAAGVPRPDRPKEIPIGKGELLTEGDRVALLGYGYGVQVALRAAGILGGQGLQVTVADGRFAKPLDEELVRRLGREHELLVTIEENVLPGGFGSAVLEHLEDSFADPAARARVMRVGLPDRYVAHGKPALLREEVGFTGEAVAERVLSALRVEAPVAGS